LINNITTYIKLSKKSIIRENFLQVFVSFFLSFYRKCISRKLLVSSNCDSH